MHPLARLGARTRRVGAVAVFLWAGVAHGHPPEPLDPASREALALCQAADQVPISERSVLLASGLERAEEALKAAPRDAVAHFAVFCNLGKRLQMRPRGWGLLAGFGDLRRARQELDVALALAPDYAAALAAKGQMLLELPRFLGGDRRQGEALLRRAVSLEPDDPQMRSMLANVVQISEGRDEASARTAVAGDAMQREVSSGEIPISHAFAPGTP